MLELVMWLHGIEFRYGERGVSDFDVFIFSLDEHDRMRVRRHIMASWIASNKFDGDWTAPMVESAALDRKEAIWYLLSSLSFSYISKDTSQTQVQSSSTSSCASNPATTSDEDQTRARTRQVKNAPRAWSLDQGKSDQIPSCGLF